MKKILLVLSFLALIAANAAAGYPDDLSNILPEDAKLVNEKAGCDEISQEQSARLIMWAAAKDLKNSNYKYPWRILSIADHEKDKLVKILENRSIKRKKSLQKDLANGQIHLIRDGKNFTASVQDNSCPSASFAIGFNSSYRGPVKIGISEFFVDYILRPNSSYEIINQMCLSDEALEGEDKASLYEACLYREDLSQEIIDYILDKAHKFLNPELKLKIYRQYLRSTTIDPVQLDEIFQQGGVMGQDYLAKIYVDYILRDNTDYELILDKFENSKTFDTHNQVIVKAAYMRCCTDPDVVKEIWDEALENSYSEVFAAYASRLDTDIKVVELNINKSISDDGNYLMLNSRNFYAASLIASYVGRYDADQQFISKLIDRVSTFVEGSRLLVYEAYLKKNKVLNDYTVNKVLNYLSFIKRGALVIQKFKNQRRFKKTKSAQSVIIADSDIGKRPRSEFDNDGDQGGSFGGPSLKQTKLN